MIRIATLAIMLFVLSGCKIAVIVAEGGEVQSVGSGTCTAGTACFHEATYTNFSESFTAVPAAGWEFVRWNTGGDFFCENLTDATCSLSLQGLAGNALVEALVASPKTFYIMPIFQQGLPITDTITVADKEWAQADLFVDLSWDDINAVCPAGSCINSGTLNGYDVAGWTWASVNDVGDLFNATTPHPGGIGEYQTFFASNQWAKDFFDVVGFRPTGTLIPFVALRETVGHLASPPDQYGFILESNVPGEPVGLAYTGDIIPTLSIIGTGAWLYRVAAP